MNRGRAPGPGKLWKRGNAWVLDYRDVSGKRRRKVLGQTKRVAERRRLDLIARRDMELDGLGSREGQTMLVTELIGQYLADLKPRVTPRHYKNVDGRMTRLLPQLEGLRVRDLRPPLVVRLRTDAVARGLSNRTANLIADNLKWACTWAVENGLIAENPVQHIKRLPETAEHQRYRRRAMSEDEIAKFLDASEEDDRDNELRADLEGWTRVPTTPMWRAFLETGARWNELRQTRWGDLDAHQAQLVLRAENTKSRKTRVIPLRRELVDELQRLRVIQETVLGRIPTINDSIFLTPEGCGWPRPTTNAMRVFDRVLTAAGIAKVNPDGRKVDIHGLRHTCGTRLARGGATLVQTQRIMGHSDPKLTAQVYTHLDAEDLRGAVEALSNDNYRAGNSRRTRID